MQVKVLFLGGLGRSGTTLVERVLGQLPGTVSLGEVVHLWRRDLRDNERCGCGVPFSDCDFWQRVGAYAFGGWSAVDVDRVLRLRATVERTRHIPKLRRPRLPQGFYQRVREYAYHYHRVYVAAARVADASVVIDSSKHPALAYCLRWRPEIDLRVVHVVRDSRGVAYSWTKKVTRPESDGDQMTRYHPLRSALLWNSHNAAIDALARYGVPVKRVRYEDFIADPIGVTKELAEFAGVDTGPLGFFRFRNGTDVVELGTTHSAAGNPMRFATGRIRLRHDDEWRTELRPGHRWLVTTVTAPLLSAYGYRR